MSVFPKIDQACPLDADAQRGVGRFCGHCSKPVHALDAMSDAARAAFLRDAGGSVCVSYRVRAGHAAAFGLGAALLVGAALPAHAQDTAPVERMAASASATPATGTRIAPAAQPDKLEPIMVMGAVSDPHAAQWVDAGDDDVPELPVQHEAAKAKR